MEKPILILVAGGTASGKTTVVSEITSYFNSNDISVVLMDNYYKRRDDISLEERKKINYDHPNSFDLDLLKTDLKSLIEGNIIYSPSYDFTVHNRSNNKILIRPSKVIIVEGILSMYDNDIRNLADIKIFVESEPDIRFIRRLKRDIKERGRTLDEVVEQYLATVKPMHDLYVEPCKRFADIIIPNNDKHDVALGILSAKIKDIIWQN
ncbi:MAG: uridine kinase [Acholeplasmatales bacterium]|nr:uridine kinase [Acholeplasmatales bacterium]